VLRTSRAALAAFVTLSSFFLAIAPAGSAGAAVLVYDDFDDGYLTGAWTLTFLNTNAWTYVESGTELTVTDIVDYVVDEDWAIVRLSQSLPTVTDFDLDFEFSWDSEGSGDAMQCVFVWLYGSLGEVIAGGGAWDAWRLNPGSKYGQVGGASTPSSIGSIPLTGSASVNISRTGDTIAILWNDAPLYSGTETGTPAEVAIEFKYYHQSGSTTSFFGNESVDLVRLEVPDGPALVPEMDVQGGGSSIADGDSTPSAGDATDFGLEYVTSGAVEHVFTIENTGQAVLYLTGLPLVQISGANAGDFTVTGQPSTPIAAGGGATTFTVRFDPSGVGLRTAVISIGNDDSDENPYSFAIQGTGSATPVPSTSALGAALVCALLLVMPLWVARRRASARL
jgi:hypothetical protein